MKRRYLKIQNIRRMPVSAQVREDLREREMLLAHVRLENFKDLSRDEQLFRLRQILDQLPPDQQSDCRKAIGELTVGKIVSVK